MRGSEPHVIDGKVYVHIGSPWNQGHWVDQTHHVEVTVDGTKHPRRVREYLLKFFKRGVHLEIK